MKQGRLLKLGAFILMMATLVGVLVVVFAGATFWRTQEPYYVRIPDSVYGLEEGAEVDLNGVRIGRVTELDVTSDGAAVNVVLGVRPEVTIPADAHAVLKFKGVTGLKLIDIVGGSVRAPPLKPGSRIAYEPSAVDVLADRANELAIQATHLLEQSSRVAEQVSTMLSGFDPEQVGAIFDRTERLLATLDRSAARLDTLLKDTQAPMMQVTDDIGVATRRADAVLTDAEDVLQNLNALITELHAVVKRNDDEVRATTRNLKQASQYFEELARRLRERPSRILFSRPPKERELP